MGSASKRAAATPWLIVVAVAAAAVISASAGGENPGGLSCFCDCMKNQCMTLGTAPDKKDCASACTEGCIQIGQPGQLKEDDFCGF